MVSGISASRSKSSTPARAVVERADASIEKTESVVLVAVVFIVNRDEETLHLLLLVLTTPPTLTPRDGVLEEEEEEEEEETAKAGTRTDARDEHAVVMAHGRIGRLLESTRGFA